MDMEDKAGLSPEALQQLQQEIGSMDTLLAFLNWRPQNKMVRAVTMDEFSIDVILSHGRQFLVLDTT